MIEVLISIVVIAFGLLGVAGLQAFAVKNNQSASMRITASTLALDMVDRVSANWPGAGVGGYNKVAPADYAAPVSSCKTLSGCTGLDIAATDLSDWSTLVRTALPNGRGIVCLDATPNDGVDDTAHGCDAAGGTNTTNYVVKIWWRDDRSASANLAAPQRFSWPFITWPLGP